jgi:hypothetical protein
LMGVLTGTRMQKASIEAKVKDRVVMVSCFR